MMHGNKGLSEPRRVISAVTKTVAPAARPKLRGAVGRDLHRPGTNRPQARSRCAEDHAALPARERDVTIQIARGYSEVQFKNHATAVGGVLDVAHERVSTTD